MKETENKICVIGGGLAGLISAILLARKGKDVLLIEKKIYPFHRVCGEYISNEVLDFLKRERLYPDSVDMPQISRFEFSDTHGRAVQIPLDLGGFGVSRYVLDAWLFQQANDAGVDVKCGIQVSDVQFEKSAEKFQLTLSDQTTLEADYVIGAFGKRSRLDKVLARPFMEKRSPYIGVKYHIRADFARDTVALYNFDGGYCGLNAIEDQKVNLCYLGSRDQLRECGSIGEMERQVLWKNPILKRIFAESDFLFEKPEVINEINFEPKSPVENHLLMAGDAAGLITPLCGNGMAMAIHSGKMAAEAILAGKERDEVESIYSRTWNAEFRQRLWVGRKIQRLFGATGASVFTRSLIQHIPFFAKQIIKKTHGNPF
ncbi:NAD(P)/FAD-dependent oxidoreductase [Algoriphagus terrigena]|uniref:NAD(P)/FAD-dependent oxidoreductase n=1 Tax=Algoriphagus terrigena TaxID=344884 RepID=UPI000418EF4E|nr:NAD(P)/FAD-dependent oxidoreductase [Algoriphagus terrigena]